LQNKGSASDSGAFAFLDFNYKKITVSAKWEKTVAFAGGYIVH